MNTKIVIFLDITTNFKNFFEYLYIMKIEVSEKQFNTILKNITENQEVSEQEAASTNSEPSAGTSSQQGGGQGYPQVGKWESGVTRGPANQIGVTKWADIVGSVLKRGKSNPLK